MQSMFRTGARLFMPVVLAAVMAACASSGAVPKPFPMPGGRASSGKPAPPPKVAGLPGSVKPAPLTKPASAAEPAHPAASDDAAVSPRPAHTDGYAITSTALALRGTPYRNGGVDPKNGFDCSGFTQWVFHAHGVNLPREVRDQFEAGKKVKPEDLKVGDLIFFTTTAPGPTHVAIAIGGDQFIHAPSSTGVVRIERLNSAYWSKRFLSVRRVL
jgi:cell wall-associated NlpC family hydrolase